MKNFIVTFFSQPKKVSIFSIIIALAIGFWSYDYINRKPDSLKLKQSAINEMSLTFPSDGIVRSVLVKIGDTVKPGQVLATLDVDNADGALIQAESAYENAKANYEKVINGATEATIDLSKAAVNKAQVNLDQVIKQQEVLVNNAYRNLLNSSLQTDSVNTAETFPNPTITGTYSCGKEGVYNLETYSSSGGGLYVNYSGLEEGVLQLTDMPRALGNCGLFLSLDKNKELYSGVGFEIKIPNNKASNYNLNKNAYELALQTKNQAIAIAKADLDQAKASFASITAVARPEDIVVAKAQLESAYGILINNPSYGSTVVTAPKSGQIKALNIFVGKKVTSSLPVIQLSI